VTDRLRFTVLGCGSSPGTPRISGDWGACDPSEPRNRRSRAAALVERIGPRGVTRVVIDTGPDFRTQMLAAGVKRLDAVVYTHGHADHIHGIDDLRGYVLEQRDLIDIHADAPTLARLVQAFGYCFETPAGSGYPPIVRAHVIDHATTFTVAGEGGPLTITPLPQLHGDMVSLGLRVGPLAYCPDVSGFPPQTPALMRDLDLLVIDALQYQSHPSHFSLSEALAWIEKLRPRRALLTHMHVPLDYRTVLRDTPAHVEPAYDGQVVEFDFDEADVPERR
jgi:phosphoribosyl 1,2-cyclic phosphate phosphodiesterase